MMHETGERLALAEHYLNIDAPKKALDVLAAAEGEAAEASEFHYLRARCLHRLERPEERDKAIVAGLEVDPEDIGLLALASESCQDRNDLAGAERMILRALNVDPEEPVLLCQYARLVGQAFQFEKAKKLIEHAAEIDPESPAILPSRYVLAMFQGRTREAARLASEVVGQNPDNPDTLFASGLTLAELGHLSEARKQTGNAVALNPRTAEGYESELRDIKVRSHWSLSILAPVNRLGPGGFWLSFVVLFIGLNLAGWKTAAAILLVVYLSLAAYSWIGPWIVRKIMQRERA